MVDIVARCCELTGRTPDELATIIDTHDNWGHMVHAFEFLTVLGVVRDEIRTSANLKGSEMPPKNLEIG